MRRGPAWKRQAARLVPPGSRAGTGRLPAYSGETPTVMLMRPRGDRPVPLPEHARKAGVDRLATKEIDDADAKYRQADDGSATRADQAPVPRSGNSRQIRRTLQHG